VGFGFGEGEEDFEWSNEADCIACSEKEMKLAPVNSDLNFGFFEPACKLMFISSPSRCCRALDSGLLL